MKHKIMLLITICIILTFSSSAFAHSGGTDSVYGHHDHQSGGYHYHHGYPAHLHANDVCPYKIGVFDENYDSSGGFDVAEYVRHNQIQNQWNTLVAQWDNLEKEQEQLYEYNEELLEYSRELSEYDRSISEKELQLTKKEKSLKTLLICSIIMLFVSFITAVGSFVYIKKHKSNIK